MKLNHKKSVILNYLVTEDKFIKSKSVTRQINMVQNLIKYRPLYEKCPACNIRARTINPDQTPLLSARFTCHGERRCLPVYVAIFHQPLQVFMTSDWPPSIYPPFS